MHPARNEARLAGLLYLLMSIAGIFSVLYVPSVVVVPGDAAATARRIGEAAFLYRVAVLGDLFASILFLFVGWSLYHLLEDVSRRLATLMVILVSVSAAVSVVLVVGRIAPLVLLSGADFLAVLPKAHLEALALGSLRLHGKGVEVVSAFWGLWLFPFGILVIRSGFFPKILGVLLLVAGLAYLTGSATSIVFPARSALLARILMPLQAAELPMLVWLLVKGAKVPLPQPA
jgi:hypothetical protein